MLSIDWSPGDDAAKLCENLKEDDFGPDLYVQQGINNLFEDVASIILSN